MFMVNIDLMLMKIGAFKYWLHVNIYDFWIDNLIYKT